MATHECKCLDLCDCVCFCCVALCLALQLRKANRNCADCQACHPVHETLYPLAKHHEKKKKTLLCFSLKQRGTFERTRLTASRQPRAGNINLNKSKQNELIDVRKVQTLRLCRQQEALRPLYYNPTAVQFSDDNRPLLIMFLIQTGFNQSGHTERK